MRSEGPRELLDGGREEVCPKVCPALTGFFGCAMPATFARRASLRLRMTSDFDDSDPGLSAVPLDRISNHALCRVFPNASASQPPSRHTPPMGVMAPSHFTFVSASV